MPLIKPRRLMPLIKKRERSRACAATSTIVRSGVMAIPAGGGLFCMVELNCYGEFVRQPFSYANGQTFMIDNHDFSSQTYAEFVTWIGEYTQKEFKQIYYCEPEKTLEEGIRTIANEIDYSGFIYDAYGTYGKISVYVDHAGAGIERWFEDDSNDEEDHDSCIMGEENEEGEDDVRDGDAETEKMNRTADDEFLSKLTAGKDDNSETNNDEGIEVDSANILQEHSIFNELIPWKKQKPIVGMRFKDPKQMKTMLCNYAVANGYQLVFEKNDSKRLLVKCCKGECTFRLWGSWMADEESFQIKSLIDQHNCAKNFKFGSLVTYAWIGSHYTKDILLRQKLSVRKLRLEVQKKFGIQVSLGQCRRAKQYAMSLIEGNLVEHYARLWSYSEEIRRSNPGSTVKVDVNHMGDGKNYFSKMYVCFDAIKRGWKEGCRRIIGLDGCFLKGICKGELLSAIGRDANNQIYPIAWAVVCVENKQNWKWFLDNLIDDLDLHLGKGISLMSDQHKGLIEAVKEMLPFAEHRQCARHIAQNLKRRYSGAHYEKLFWRACKSTTEPAFKSVMKELEAINPNAHKYLMDKDPKTWSLAYYQTGRCCDSVENGMSESFNALILDARKKPIITMLEELRLYMMERMYNLKKKGQPWGTQICPEIREIGNEIKIKQRGWQVLPSGLSQFEVRGTGDAYEVDLDRKTCSCRLWQLNGYGCVHSIACVSFLNRDVESYVDPMFSTVNYMKSYNNNIKGMNGSSMWPETEYIPPLPPKARRMPGRPSTKRKRDAVENLNNKHKVSKVGKKGKCSICKEVGHNKSTCRLDKGKNTNAIPNPGVGVQEDQVVNDELDEAAAIQMEADQRELDEAMMGGDKDGEVHNDGTHQEELDLTPPTMEDLTQPEPVTQRQEEVQTTPRINVILHNIRRKKSERIMKLKLAKTVGGPSDRGNTKEKPLQLA